MADILRIYVATYSIKNLGNPQHSDVYKLCNFVYLVLEVEWLVSINLRHPIKITGLSIQILADQSSIDYYGDHIKLVKQNDAKSGT